MNGFASLDIDPDLVARARDGDRDAAGGLCRALAPAVYSTCLRLTQRPAVAEDLTQETFVEMLRAIGDFRGDASIATWVRHIAVSRCMMFFRSAWQRRARPLADAHAFDAADATDPGLERDLDRALASLPEAARVVVWLFDVEGYTHREIATLTGRSESYSKSCLARAHARLREWLEPAANEAAPAPEQAKRCLA